MTTTPDDTAMADTHARLLALEMVTSALLNQLAAKDPDLQAVLRQLAEPSRLPDTAALGDPDNLVNLQANVARLAGVISARL